MTWESPRLAKRSCLLSIQETVLVFFRNLGSSAPGRRRPSLICQLGLSAEGVEGLSLWLPHYSETPFLEWFARASILLNLHKEMQRLPYHFTHTITDTVLTLLLEMKSI